MHSHRYANRGENGQPPLICQDSEIFKDEFNKTSYLAMYFNVGTSTFLYHFVLSFRWMNRTTSKTRCTVHYDDTSALRELNCFSVLSATAPSCSHMSTESPWKNEHIGDPPMLAHVEYFLCLIWYFRRI